MTGIKDYKMIDEAGGIQWPFAEGSSLSSSERRLFENGQFFHGSGRAKFIFANPEPLPEPPCPEYPFLLLTGRGTSAQWHTQTRTDKSEILRQLYPKEIYVEVNPNDARVFGIESDNWVCVESRRGSLKARAIVTGTIASGHLFIPMHYPATNQLTLSVFDPHSRQPAYKACAVRIHATLKDKAGKGRSLLSRLQSTSVPAPH
jgi:assimilatory nitrate reductase catalytic subunit